MTKIQKVVRDIQNLQDFYKRTKLLRARIKKKDLERSKVEQGAAPGARSRRVFCCSQLREKLLFCQVIIGFWCW